MGSPDPSLFHRCSTSTAIAYRSPTPTAIRFKGEEFKYQGFECQVSRVSAGIQHESYRWPMLLAGPGAPETQVEVAARGRVIAARRGAKVRDIAEPRPTPNHTEAGGIVIA